MRTNSSRLPLAIPFLLLCSLILGCDTTNDMAGPSQAQIEATASSEIESITSTPIVGESGELEYLLKIRLRQNPDRVVLPEAINILSQREGVSNIAIYDSGTGVDSVRNDGVYTGVVPEACINGSGKSIDTAEKAGAAKCKIEFVGPGEKCGKFGYCPRTAHRSFLWGLIEYDTKVVLCFCLIECDFLGR